ncbi:MAG: serine/threonine-protein kinase [Pseudohongiellaceae bacterium]|jgi:serine/threonine-protein kinase
MKHLFSILFSIQIAVLLVALGFIFYSPLPPEFMLLDQQLLSLTGGESALSNPAHWQRHNWYPLLIIMPWVMTLSVVLFLLPRLRAVTATLASLLLIAALAALQLIAQLRLELHLPQGLLIQYLIFASPVIILWASRCRAWRHILAQRDQAYMELSSHKLQQGQLEQAHRYLNQCEPSIALAKLGYELAQQHEQKSSYQKAQATYRWIAGFAPKYKDVTVKANASLSEIAIPTINSMEATQTMAVGVANKAQTVLGRYQIQRELGRGAMGIVYLGIDPKISRQVAIKTLNYNAFEEADLEEVKQRFFREAEAAGRLTHPNIVTIFDVGEEPDLSFIAMDYIAGETLREHITTENLLTIPLVFQLVAQVADALDYAHHLHIVHRDIKPGNLLYNPENQQVKVADFGLARIVDNSRTKTGSILGSPIYMSPEQLKGHKATPASDIYSLGASLYQLLTGQPPYNGESIADLAYKIVNEKFTNAREIRKELPASATRIINKAMAKDADKRYENAAAMATALRNALRKDFGIRD